MTPDPIYSDHMAEERDLMFSSKDAPAKMTKGDAVADLIGLVIVAAIIFGMWFAL